MITAEQMTREEMERTAKTHVCAICCGPLSVAWINGAYALRCQDINHDKVVPYRHRRKTERELTHEQVWKETNKVDSTSLVKMDKASMLARIEVARFPQELTKEDKLLLAEAATTYGLDPVMGELSIYQARPFVSIDGRYRKAQETDKLDGVQTRPATKQEREDWQIPQGDYFFRAEVYVKGASHPFVGWGRVRAAEMAGGKGFKPVETNPQRMAEKRAEAQALRKAFHINLPSREDIGLNEVGQVVDVSTGEVIEGSATVVEEQPKAEPQPEAKPQEQPATEAQPSLMPKMCPVHNVPMEERISKQDGLISLTASRTGNSATGRRSKCPLYIKR